MRERVSVSKRERESVIDSVRKRVRERERRKSTCCAPAQKNPLI